MPRGATVNRVPPGRYVPCEAHPAPSQMGESTSEGNWNVTPANDCLLVPLMTSYVFHAATTAAESVAVVLEGGVITGVMVSVSSPVGALLGKNCRTKLDSQMPPINRAKNKIIVNIVPKHPDFFLGTGEGV